MCKSPLFLLTFIILVLLSSCKKPDHRIPFVKIESDNLRYIDSAGTILYPFRVNNRDRIEIKKIDSGTYHISFSLPAAKESLKDICIPIRFRPGNIISGDEIKKYFHWVPNMKMNKNQIISQHVFRSPAIILTYKKTALAVIPDLDLMKEYPVVPYYMDLSFEKNGAWISYGISNYSVVPHQYYERSGVPYKLDKEIRAGLFILCRENSSPGEILEKTVSFLWNHYAVQYDTSFLPQVLPFEEYAERGYRMAFEKFWVNGSRPGTGGITLSTFYDQKTRQYRGRFFKDDLWFHSWFNNLRTAYGLYLWGRETGKEEWRRRALSVFNLFMSCPADRGFFPTIWVPGKNTWITSGQGGGEGLYHIPDNAWTAIWLMRFNDELEPVPGCDSFLVHFARALLKTQNADGSFPARVKIRDLSPDPVLRSSASGSIVTWFLEEMVLRNKLPAREVLMVKNSVLKSLDFLGKKVLPAARFEDFEVYFSCSPKPYPYFDSVTWSYPENTLSIQWCASAFLKARILCDNPVYLDEGEYCLNLLSLYQQVWNPPYISLYAFGGFGTQNSDAEWSDARQAQFAETYLDYYWATGRQEYLQRGIAACRASFALMDIPENKDICPLNFRGTAFNGEFPGAMAENFGHPGTNERSGQSGFHWGTGSALTTAAIFSSKLGNILVDERTKTATGFDGTEVKSYSWGDTLKILTDHLNNINQLKVKVRHNIKTDCPINIDGSDSGYTIN